jgi:hypothetical protein
MLPTNESEPSEQPNDNPYAAPKAEIRPLPEATGSVTDEGPKKRHLRRETSLRVGGLFGLIVACLVILAFGLGILSEIRRFDSLSGEGGEPWLYQRWVVRMTGVMSLAVLAATSCWGLFRLRNWGRWTLTIVTVLPIPALLCGWFLLNRTTNPTLQATLNPGGLTALSVMSVPSCSLLLSLMWSPKGRTVFEFGYVKAIRKGPHERAGCLAIIVAFGVALAGLASYIVLLITALSILVILGLIHSI